MARPKGEEKKGGRAKGVTNKITPTIRDSFQRLTI